MIKTEVEKRLADALSLKNDEARDLLNVILDEITLALSRRQKVALIGFGTFEVREHKARQGRNPQTGEAMTIPASYGVHFKPGKALKDRVPQP
ncbi:MAG: HU family DNA-binding protein [Ketobacteraceae bacterium]|nr:HU family DNA-binding protein [Ketobacteraceae bacterium]